jgi:hypothetical protein
MRGRNKAEPPLVGDLVARLGPYKTEGAACKHCRRFVSLEEAKAADWWHFAGGLYCPACAATELGLGDTDPSGAPSSRRLYR